MSTSSSTGPTSAGATTTCCGTVNHTLFLVDGSPVRAKVTVTMRDARRTLGSDNGAEAAC